ncbi:hypothetical protein [Brevibacterium jeotgali]|uniref:Uncharacterized protein n=1 Tax=Brevibacterium jeotgali TaxID=1262550 RepID=A0A2H1L222_9MICO|nr:hypothetical protein [Brevibacterium jeotgali]TWC01874.1 hypothetical protein FB108_0532 [Brevibacterium jeotgali]SMY10775.1 hypothetical protein BJEO58_00350 [Brevibacterium jeotgali]
MTAPASPSLGALPGIAPGTLLATIAVTTESGTLALADEATAVALHPLAAGPGDVRAARIALSPGASVSTDAPTSVQAEAVVTALLGTREGTVAEVTVTLTNAPSADVPTADAEVLGTVELSILTNLPAPHPLAAPGSREWARLLQERLVADQEFTELIETYDGTIGLRIGGREVHIRCYRGRVLEVSPRSIRGADFVIDISGAEFISLMTAEANMFMESAMLRRLSSSGSGYEYLRMTTALIRVIDLCRSLAADAGWGHSGASDVPGAAVTEGASA